MDMEHETKQETITVSTPEEARRKFDEVIAIERANAEPLRSSIETSRLKRDEAGHNVDMAEEEITKLERSLHQWRRWRDYQKTRVAIFDRRMRNDREELRAIEDFESGAE